MSDERTVSEKLKDPGLDGKFTWADGERTTKAERRKLEEMGHPLWGPFKTDGGVNSASDSVDGGSEDSGE